MWADQARFASWSLIDYGVYTFRSAYFSTSTWLADLNPICLFFIPMDGVGQNLFCLLLPGRWGLTKASLSVLHAPWDRLKPMFFLLLPLDGVGTNPICMLLKLDGAHQTQSACCSRSKSPAKKYSTLA